VALAEKSPWLVKVLTISLLLHLVAAPVQVWVVDHFYHGVADWLRYDNEGVVLAGQFRHFDFSGAFTNTHRLVGDGIVSTISGLAFAVVGTNQVGVFLVFSWFAFIGLICFYRAFTLTFEGADTRRYAILLFFLPSLLFWTADVSKEAIMTFALGLVAYGAAKILRHRRGGITLIVIGSVLAGFVRPNELLLVAAGLVVAIMIMPSSPWRNLSGLRRILSFVFLSAVLGISIYLTVHFLHGKGGSLSLQQISQNNSGHGSSVVAYSSSPSHYPKDVYTVLFDPLPINAHGKGELLAAIENMILIGVMLTSWRQLRVLVRASFARPYVMMCIVYSLTFLYAFAALGDLGLITRERTLLLPFMLVIFSIPRTPKGEAPRYEWELRRRARLERRRQGQAAGQHSPVPSTAPSKPTYHPRPRPAPRSAQPTNT